MHRFFPVVLAIAIAGSVSAQDTRMPAEVLSLEKAMDVLPNHAVYRVQLAPSGMSLEQQEQLAIMIGDAVAGRHFYGAIYSYRPDGQGTTEMKMRSGLHSREAARAVAEADCEAARASVDGPCTLVGDILPEEWNETMPELSHVAVQALQETFGQLPGNVVVARSRSGDGFEIRAGDDVREVTLSACNSSNSSAGLPPDCEIVIDDLARSD